MSVFDMLKKVGNKKQKPEEPPKQEPKQEPLKYDKSYFEDTLQKYLVDPEIVETVIPAFMALSNADREGKLVDMMVDILEYKEQEIETLYENEDKFSNESEGESTEEPSDTDNQNEDYLMQVLAERYGEK